MDNIIIIISRNVGMLLNKINLLVNTLIKNKLIISNIKVVALFKYNIKL